MEGHKASRISAALVLLMLVFCVGHALAAEGLLSAYESGGREFKKGEFGDKVVYYHQRMIGAAVVEKDRIVYKFDKSSGDLIRKEVRWREGLPEELPAGLIPKEEAWAIAGRDVRFSKLYYISPDSDVFPIEPTPGDPCWVVHTVLDGRPLVKVVNAVTGELLGEGVPPPYTAFSFSGPWECPYYGAWTTWYQNAANWFDTMGYLTYGIQWPTLAEIREHVKSDYTAMFYELNHGGSASFMYGCDEGTGLNVQAFKVSMWIAARAKMPFTFLGSCEGMCDTLGGSFSDAFRKSSWEATTTVGYCHMAESWCSDCWTESIQWQNALFGYMNQGWSVYGAFLEANADVPSCGLNECMRFAGDPTFAVVPVVQRDPISPQVEVISPNGGEIIEYNTDCEIIWNASDNARVTSVTIVLSTDGGTSYPDTIAKDEDNDGSFLWTVPDVDSKTARIKVLAYDGVPHEGSDASDSDFTLWGSTSGVAGWDFTGVPARVVLRVVNGGVLTSGTEIVFGLPRQADVRIGIYDAAGRHLRDLVNGRREEGYHSLGWNWTGPITGTLSPGIYFLRLDTGQDALTAKVVIAR
jgi:hypothetical protein